MNNLLLVYSFVNKLTSALGTHYLKITENKDKGLRLLMYLFKTYCFSSYDLQKIFFFFYVYMYLTELCEGHHRVYIFFKLKRVTHRK